MTTLADEVVSPTSPQLIRALSCTDLSWRWAVCLARDAITGVRIPWLPMGIRARARPIRAELLFPSTPHANRIGPELTMREQTARTKLPISCGQLTRPVPA